MLPRPTRSQRQDPPSGGNESPGGDRALHRALVELDEATGSTGGVESCLQIVVRRACEAIGVDHGFVATLEPGGTAMGVRASQGLFDTQRTTHFAPRVGMIGRVWARGEAILVEDYESWSGRGIDMQAAGARALALTPIRSAQQVIGVIGVASGDPHRPLATHHLERLETFAHLVPLVLRAHERPVHGTRGSVPGRGPASGGVDAELAHAFRSLPGFACIKDRENRILRANEAVATHLGLPLEEIEGSFLWELDPENAALSFRFDLDVIHSGEPLVDHLEERTDPAGERHWWSVDRVPLLDSSGAVEALLVHARDVTTLQVSRARLEASQRAAARADRTKAHMLATLAHEVCTPLERLDAMTDELSRASDPERVFDRVRELRTTAECALAQVRDLIDFARVEAGNEPVRSEPFSVRGLVEDVLELSWQNALALDVTLVGHVDPSIPSLVLGDGLRVRQVLVQLVARSLRAVRGGEVVVSARTVLQSGAQWEVRLEILASEWRLTLQELQDQFGPFLRGEEAMGDAGDVGATGLLLAHRLVQLLGGRAGVQSSPDGGMCCWCSLPFERVDETVSAMDRIRPRGATRSLIVHPRATSARVLAEELVEMRSLVDVAHDPREAIAMIEQARGDGWAYDVCMVHHTAVEADPLEWIGALGPRESRNERTILLVPFGFDPLRPSTHAVRMDARLTEPIRRSHLEDLLVRLVGTDDPFAEADAIAVDDAADERTASMRVFVLEADPLHQRLISTALRRMGCVVESHSDVDLAIARLRAEGDDGLAACLVDPRLRARGGRGSIEAIRAADLGRGHRTVVALADASDLEQREWCLAAGADGVIGRPPDYAALRQLLARRRRSVRSPARS